MFDTKGYRFGVLCPREFVGQLYSETVDRILFSDVFLTMYWRRVSAEDS